MADLDRILRVWRMFDGFPMETLTKAWHLKHRPEMSQRSVQVMINHRARSGASGNCFDLAIWLIHEFEKIGVKSYGVGESLGTVDAHVGVVALDDGGRRYLCDLGDLWIQPLAIENSGDLMTGYFTGAQIRGVERSGVFYVEFHRRGGKVSHQTYDLKPVNSQDLVKAGEILQAHLSDPLVEMRIREPGEVVHWEFENGCSAFSRLSGLEHEEPCVSASDWAARISRRTGMNAQYVYECLEAHRTLS